MPQTKTTSRQVPLTLLRHQGPMLKTLGSAAVESAWPFGRRRNPEHFETASAVMSPLPAALVDRYVAWAGGEHDYAENLPPHLLSQWAMPMAARVIRQSRYPMASIVNQGVSMTVNGELPRDEPIRVEARLLSLEETSSRARLAIGVDSGTSDRPDLVSAVLHVHFPLPGPREPRADGPAVAEEPSWETVGSWSTDRRDGLRFGLLTGDLNPIHWVGLAGRVSPFGSTVLLGFGMFVRTYEQALPAVADLTTIDVRFLKPVKLPSDPLLVQTASSSAGHTDLRLVSRDGRAVHLAGTLR